jgi:hypothetical protein
MRVHVLPFALSALIVSGVASETRAQEQEAGPTRVEPWSVSLGFQTSYEHDSEFGDNPGQLSRGLTGQIGRAWTLKRGSLNVSAHGDQYNYTEDQPDRLMYGFTTGGSYTVTPRVTWRMSGSMDNSYAKDSSVLQESGLIVQTGAMSKTYVGSTDLSYALSARSTMSGSVSYTRVGFDASSGLSSGASVMIKLEFSRELTRTQSLSLSFGDTYSSGLTGDIQGLLATWQKKIGQGLSLSLGGGVRPYTLYGESGKRIAPGAHAGLTGVISDTQSVTVTYDYAVEQAYGFNRTHLANRFNGSYELSIGRKFDLTNSLNYGLNTYPQIPGYVLGGWTYSTGVRYLLLPNLALQGSYGYWLTQETGVPSTSSYRAVVGLSYGFGWRD